ncbi:hypothetical protein HDU67_000493 [Dinochytrium kinnereticum]|nr:hypothetical protein HDU67_000493 [Dinochytrium kinnereticum]
MLMLGARLAWALQWRGGQQGMWFSARLLQPEVFWSLGWIVGVDIALLFHVEPVPEGQEAEALEEARQSRWGIEKFVQLDFFIVIALQWASVLGLVASGSKGTIMVLFAPISGILDLITKAHQMNAKAEVHLAATKIKRSGKGTTITSRNEASGTTKYRRMTTTVFLSLSDRIELDKLGEETSIVHLSGLNLPSWFYLINMPRDDAKFYLFVLLGVFGELLVQSIVLVWRRHRLKQIQMKNIGLSVYSLDITPVINSQLNRTHRKKSRQQAFSALYDFIGVQTCILCTSSFSIFFTSTDAILPMSLQCASAERLDSSVIARRALFSCAVAAVSSLATILLFQKIPIYQVASSARVPLPIYLKTACLNFALCSSLLAISQFFAEARGFQTCESRSKS